MVHRAKNVNTDWLVVRDAAHAAIRLKHCDGPSKTRATKDNNTILSQLQLTLSTHRWLQTIEGFLESRSSDARVVRCRKNRHQRDYFPTRHRAITASEKDSSQRDPPSTRGHP